MNVADNLSEIAEQLVKEYKTEDNLFGSNGIFKELKRRVLEAALEGEMEAHLGYERHERSSNPNSRNGYGKKHLQTEDGQLAIKVPRDRDASFTPEIVGKRETGFREFDDKILGLYARGSSTTDIQAHLEELYGMEISSSFISSVTTAVKSDVQAWRSRPLEPLYIVVYLDAIVVKVREEKQIKNKAVYLALGLTTSGHKELLGLWMSENEGAKFWLHVMTELKNRGIQDILIACVDGLNGFPEAIEAVFPQTTVQLCIVHMVRNSLRFVGWKDKKSVAADLKKIYTATTVEDAQIALDDFAKKWDDKFPSISRSWRANWVNVIPFLDYPLDIRKAIYTTNAIESLNMTLRNVIKNKRLFPNDDSVFNIIYLAIDNISKKWTMPIKDWNSAMNQFMIKFEDRISI